MASKRVLILGGTGFIGSHLAMRLNAHGWRVRCIARMINKEIGSHRTEGVDYLGGDVVSGISGSVFKDVDVVYHLAWPCPEACAAWSVSSQYIAAAERIALQCIEADVRKLIFASSGGAVYGRGSGHCIREDSLCSPVSPYGQAKLLAEHRLMQYAHVLPITIVRPSNVYGRDPQRRPTRGLVDMAVHHAFSQEPLQVFVPPDTRRDFVHIDDVIAALEELALSHLNPSLINIGSGRGASIGEVIRLVNHLSGKELRVAFSESSRHAEVRENALSSARLHRLFPALSTPLTLEKGISRLIYAKSGFQSSARPSSQNGFLIAA